MTDNEMPDEDERETFLANLRIGRLPRDAANIAEVPYRLFEQLAREDEDFNIQVHDAYTSGTGYLEDRMYDYTMSRKIIKGSRLSDKWLLQNLKGRNPEFWLVDRGTRHIHTLAETVTQQLENAAITLNQKINILVERYGLSHDFDQPEKSGK
jgi:hypothetical protein